jgi:imidazolonepropionase-like amidohydrolase
VSGSLNSTTRVAANPCRILPLFHAEKRDVNALDRGRHAAVRPGMLAASVAITPWIRRKVTSLMETTMTVLRTGWYLPDVVFAVERGSTDLLSSKYRIGQIPGRRGILYGMYNGIRGTNAEGGTVSTMKAALAIGVVLSVALALRGSAAQSEAPLAFTNVSVVPMDSPRVLADHTVIVANGRITVVGPAATTLVPEGAVTIDGRNKHLMPGLAELHGHIPPPATTPKAFIDDMLFLYVANGVTTVRGMQGAAGQLALREAAGRGDMIAPNLYLAGPAFNGNNVRTAHEAAARVLEQKSEGWDLLKIQGALNGDAYHAMARAAREVAIPFAGHVPSAVGVTRALEMGQSTIDHLDGFAEHLDGVTKPIDESALQDLVARTKRSGSWVVPTLVVWETLRGPVTLHSRTTLPELRYMPPTTVEQWTKSLEKRLNAPEFNQAEAKQYIDNRLRILWSLHAAGVGVLLGSDAPQQFNVPGFSIHREMKRMTDAGMIPYEIIKAGTSNVGQHFKAHDDFGTIAVGQRADLILLDGNPLEDLAHIERPGGVMVRGRWLPRTDIQARLDQVAGRHQSSAE